MTKEIQQSRPAWEKFAHALLATTCLSLGAGGVASAGTITEGTSPAPANFPGTSPGYLLPLGTTQVIGVLSAPGEQDWFEFQGLEAGQTFTLLGQYNPPHQEQGTNFFTFDTSTNPIGTGNRGAGHSTLESAAGPEVPIVGTIPNDGNLIVEVTGSREGGSAYTFTMDAPLGSVQATPEPSTLIPVGLGIAGALAWRRKRAARS